MGTKKYALICRWLNVLKFTRFLGGPNGPKICGGRTKTDFKDRGMLNQGFKCTHMRNCSTKSEHKGLKYERMLHQGQFEAHRRLIIVPVLLVLISAAILSAWLTFLSFREPAAGPSVVLRVMKGYYEGRIELYICEDVSYVGYSLLSELLLFPFWCGSE